jgi:hypothetical protein
MFTGSIAIDKAFDLNSYPFEEPQKCIGAIIESNHD